ncbi:MAG: 50S ribosomal protein L3 [Patescibacteria group bacterium]
MKFILGKNLGMTQVFDQEGAVVPVTKVLAGPCFVTAKKIHQNSDVKTVQISFEEQKFTRLSKPLQGFFKKLFNKDLGFKYLKEFRFLSSDDMFDKLTVGDSLDASIFCVGDIVKAQGHSKGKGFQGVVKRHGFHGAPKSHGHKDQLRMSGSIGAKGVAHVFKGTRMGGHMGDDVVSIKNLKVVEVFPEQNIIYIKGAVPGHRNGLVYLQAEGSFEPKQPAQKKLAETIEPKNEELAQDAVKTNE